MRFVGCGEVVYDHVIQVASCAGEKEVPTYLGGRGGGSVWNAVANLAAWGEDCVAVGHCASDLFSSSAREELAFLGVDTSFVECGANDARTRLFFEYLRVGPAGTVHWFSGHCPVCQGGNCPAKEVVVSPRSNELWSTGVILLVDSIRRSEYVRIARLARLGGSVNVAILDHPSMYRYMPIAEGVRRLSHFDIIFMNESVFLSFRQRAGRAGLGNPLELLARSEGNQALIVTRGKYGADLHIMSNGGELSSFSVPVVPNRSVVDTAGAGDALCAAFLAEGGVPLLGFPERGSNLAELDWEGILGRAMRRIEPTLMAVGARGHLPGSDKGHAVSESVGRTIDELRQERGPECPLCRAAASRPARGRDRIPSGNSRRAGMKRNARNYLQARALFSLESGALERTREVLAIPEVSRTYTVGTGGSYPAAVFIAYVLSKYSMHHAQALKPHEYILRGGNSDTLLIVSASGRTPDCRRAVIEGLSRGVSNLIIVTSLDKPPIIDDIDFPPSTRVTTVKVKSKEGGFISFAGTISPAFLFCVAAGTSLLQAASLIESASKADDSIMRVADMVARSLEEYPVVHGVTSGWGWPALMDLESMFTEGNLGTLHIHEAKDFSHGRFMRYLLEDREKSPLLLLTTGGADSYMEFFEEKMRGLPRFCKVASSATEMAAGLELMLKVKHLALAVAERRGIEISRPPYIPPLGLELYKWK